MAANISFNPSLTTNAQGTFNTTSTGLVQGTAYPDPATRFALTGGILASDETIPMWGGVGLYEFIPGVSGGPVVSLGCVVGRATLLTGAKALSGFSVFDQAYGMITSPQSTVPLIGSTGQVMYYRLGSRARVAVACDPSLISLQGGLVTQQVSWDFTLQRLIPFSGGYPATTITGAVWASTAGGQTTFTVGTDLTSFINAGDDINVAGVVSTGGTGLGFNGAFTVVSITSTTIVVTQAAASSPGTYSSGGTVLAGGGALNVEVLDVQSSNCQTVSYSTATNFANWNYNGACAVILI